ncbi:MAG: hypothetical protein ACJAUH_000446 [Saprospiraceae bacterium]
MIIVLKIINKEHHNAFILTNVRHFEENSNKNIVKNYKKNNSFDFNGYLNYLIFNSLEIVIFYIHLR